jgi:hypothetical protein
MSNIPKLPDLGQFFGDTGGPGMITPNSPSTESQKNCPFLDPKMGEFCTLDGALCPFVGFNYRRCRKYTNNMAKANMLPVVPSVPNSTGGGPPRVESLTEGRKPPRKPRRNKKDAKKGGSEPRQKVDIAGVDVRNLPQEVQVLAAHIAPLGHEEPENVSEPEKKSAVQRAMHSMRTPDPSYYDADDENYILKNVHADLLAAALHQIHDVPISRSKSMGMDYTQIAHAQAGEAFNRSNKKEREDAYREAQKNKDRSAADIFTNPQVQGDKPRGGPTTNDPEDVETEREARSADSTPPPEENVPPPDDSYAPEVHPTGTRPSLAGRKFHKVTVKRSVHTKPGTRPKFVDADKADAEATVKKKKPTHIGSKSTMPQASYDKMTYEQFEQFVQDYIDPLSAAEKEHIFKAMGTHGEHQSYKQIRNDMLARAKKSAKNKNYKSIADSWRLLWDSRKSRHEIAQNRRNLEYAWDQNLEILKKFPVGERKAVEQLLRQAKRDPQQLDKAANFMNKLVDKAYNVEAKTMKIGKNELTTFIQQVTIPEFKRSDYETIRMAEQMALAAIQRQHQYGRGYGRWNTWNLFFKQVVVPFVLWYTENPKLIKPIMSIWPQALIDQFYFAYVRHVLPKLQKKDVPELQASRDTKFLNSRKMTSGRAKRIMRGWNQDAVLPPDRAVLHTRWYPTTKETWGKRRQSELVARYEKSKAQLPAVTRGSFLRR